METAKYDDCILFSTQSTTESVIYGCQWPFDHHTKIIHLKEELLSFFFLPDIKGSLFKFCLKYICLINIINIFRKW